MENEEGIIHSNATLLNVKSGEGGGWEWGGGENECM